MTIALPFAVVPLSLVTFLRLGGVWVETARNF